MGSLFLLLLSRCSSCGGTVEHQRGRRNQQRIDHHLDGRLDFPPGGESSEREVSRFTSELTGKCSAFEELGSLEELSTSVSSRQRARGDNTESAFAFST